MFADHISQLVPTAYRGVWEVIIYSAAWVIRKVRNKFLMEERQLNMLNILSDAQKFSHGHNGCCILLVSLNLVGVVLVRGAGVVRLCCDVMV